PLPKPGQDENIPRGHPAGVLYSEQWHPAIFPSARESDNRSPARSMPWRLSVAIPEAFLMPLRPRPAPPLRATWHLQIASIVPAAWKEAQCCPPQLPGIYPREDTPPISDPWDPGAL